MLQKATKLFPVTTSPLASPVYPFVGKPQRSDVISLQRLHTATYPVVLIVAYQFLT